LHFLRGQVAFPPPGGCTITLVKRLVGARGEGKNIIWWLAPFFKVKIFPKNRFF
jgi:hypothetical protein